MAPCLMVHCQRDLFNSRRHACSWLHPAETLPATRGCKTACTDVHGAQLSKSGTHVPQVVQMEDDIPRQGATAVLGDT